ncbi:MAG TPA: shikimate dehydrogenase [Vicinamibacterales bacterium]|nr:shikimate dehydrogenase [Vicinamibacterales bacterium]
MSDAQVCMVATGRTMEELRRSRDAAERADIVELRLDFVDRPDVAGALAGRRTPAIVTCRAQWEGGHFQGSEEERRRILDLAIDQGAEYVDVEAAASFAQEMIARRRGKGLVVSEHVFGPPPADIQQRFAALRSTGAEIAKLAVQVDSLAQMLPMFDIEPEPNGRGRVLIAMGTAGLASRVLAARLGSRWTYAGDGVAPGQLSFERLLRDFRFRRISGDANLYAVVGNPIAHSRSPIMHNAGFDALALNAVYVPLEARDAEDFVQFARRSGLRGASITAPFKMSLLPYFDEVDSLAQRVGAVNTLVVRDGRWIGTNTDVAGFLAPLEGRIELQGARCAVLGAGGAARAVAVALVDRGAKVSVCARRSDRAREIADAVGCDVGEFPPRAGSWDLLVNATPAGSNADPVDPMGAAPLDGKVVYELVYAPADTPLLRRATASGCATIGGIEMLIAQAERQFELFTGHRPPAGLFKEASAA